MLTVSILTLMSGVAIAQLPDELDLLVAPNSRPNVHLLLADTSAMNSAGGSNACAAGDWWTTTHGTVGPRRIHWVSAAMLGCDGVSGVVPKFYSQVNFSMRTLGNGIDVLRAPWGSSLASMKTQCMLGSAGGTLQTMGSNYDITGAMYHGAQYFAALPPVTNPCAKDFQVLVGRGNVNPTNWTFDLNCAGFTMSTNQPVPAAGYLTGCSSFNTSTNTCTSNYASADMLCAFAGEQPIPTYVVAIQPTPGAKPELVSTAAAGDGVYAEASNPQELLARLDEIISNILARSQVYFSAPQVQRDGIFAGNYVYAASFKPYPNGVWGGNVKKWCILPAQNPDLSYDTANLDCIFKAEAAAPTVLVTNANAMDVWTSVTVQDADQGGVGRRIQDATGNNLGPASGVPATPHYPIAIKTWRDGDSGYTLLKPNPVSGAGSWSDKDAWIVASERASLINRLHGYSWAAAYSGGTWSPTAVSKWPFEDPIHGTPLLFKYGTNCESTPNSCYLVIPTNAGKMYFIDTASSKGTVSSVLIPAELWNPSDANKAPLREVNNQPTTDVGHRYFLDGGVRKFHVDSNGNGIIDPTEKAYLVFSLGRGGSATYQIDMASFSGTLTDAANPIRPIKRMPNTAFNELEEMWSSPWFGRAQLSGSANPSTEVAVFPSGHINQFDVPDYKLPNYAPARTTIEDMGAPQTIDCDTLTSSDGSCSYGYDAVLGMFDVAPLTLSFGPYAVPDAIAYRLVLDAGFAIDKVTDANKDTFMVENGAGKPATAVTANGLEAAAPEGNGWAVALDGTYRTPWVFDTKVGWRIQTNGTRSVANPGFQVLSVEYIRRQPIVTGAAASCDLDSNSVCELNECVAYNCNACDTAVKDGKCKSADGEVLTADLIGRVAYPTVYVVDAHNWNGATPVNFQAHPTQIDDSVLVRITKQCTGAAVGTCVEFNAANPDLEYMTAPISGEISVYTVADRLSMLVFGDELGQIWAAYARQTAGATSWEVRRLLKLNTPNPSDPVAGPQYDSKNWRKIFRKLDIVGSTCPGRPVLGIYFGTGNLQRPSAADELTDAAVNSGRDVVGVLWDNIPPPPPAGWVTRTVADLSDVTSTAFIDPRAEFAAGKRGWFWNLAASERMLRDPFVLDGVAYFKTHRSTVAAGVCVAGAGAEAIYAVNNCSARGVADSLDAGGAIGDSVGDRTVYSANGDIGGDLLVITPEGSPPIVSAGDLSVSGNQAALAGQSNSRNMRVLYLRNPRGF